MYIYSIFGFSLYAWPLLLGYEEDINCCRLAVDHRRVAGVAAVEV